MTVQPSISDRAIAASRPIKTAEMPERERPLSELFRIAGDEWVAAKKKRDILKGLKDTVFARRKRELIDDARQVGEKMTKVDAEDIIKASTEWETYIRGLIDAEEITEAAWVRCEEIQMRFSEWNSAEANARRERNIGRQAP